MEKLEKGFVGLANALYERLYQSLLPGKETLAVLYVVRETYGFRNKTGPIYTAEMADELEVDQRYARRLLETLCERKILVKTAEAKGRNPACYTLNKNWKDWKHDRKSDFPDLKDKRSRVVDSPPRENRPEKNTRLSDENYPPKCNENTRLQAPVLPGIVSKDTIGQRRTDTPKHETGNMKHSPPTPKGEGGEFGDVSKVLKERIRDALVKKGWMPSRKEVTRVYDLVNSPAPTGWTREDWCKHVFRLLVKACDEVLEEKRNGANIFAPIAFASERLRNQMQTDAMLPPKAS